MKYANNSELPTLADKLDFLIKNKLLPHAGKTKAKTVEDEVSILLSLTSSFKKQFKIGEQALDEYQQLLTVF